MKHLNDSFLAVEEHIIEATRLLGVQCMGIDPDATRREALDELAMALTNLKTGEEDITTGDVQAKTALSPSLKEGDAEKQPEGPSPSEPHAVFKTEKDLVAFVERATNAVNGIVHDETIKKSRADMEQFRKDQALKNSLLSPGEILADRDLLEGAFEALESILELLPDLDGNENTAEVNQSAVLAWSRLRMILRWGAKAQEEEDIDTSDNDSADSAQEAENGSERAQQTSALEGVAE